MFNPMSIGKHIQNIKTLLTAEGPRVVAFFHKVVTVLTPPVTAWYNDLVARNLVTAAQVAEAKALLAEGTALAQDIAPFMAEVDKLA